MAVLFIFAAISLDMLQVLASLLDNCIDGGGSTTKGK